MDLSLSPLPIPPSVMSVDSGDNAQDMAPTAAQSSNTSGQSHTHVKHSRLSSEVEREFRHLRDLLRLEKQRGDEAEARTHEAIAHLKTINEARLKALHEAAKANEELKQVLDMNPSLEAAQKEIYRAQDVLRIVDRQRLDAEKEAADLRSKHRRLLEESKLQHAREQGRRQGIKEGIEKGRDLGLLESRLLGYNSRTRSQDAQDSYRFEDDVPLTPESYTSSSLTDHRERTPRSRPVSHTRPRSQSRAQSRPPSRQQSVTPTAASRRSAEANDQREAPIPVPPPVSRRASTQHLDSNPQSVNQEQPPPRPVSIRGPSRSPILSPAFFPPDNFIPQLDADNVIRLPPPHEFQRPPPSPERPASPQIGSETGDRQERPQSRTATPYRRARRHSSPESNSTTISQMDLVNDPGIRTPMSAIPEVTSVQTSPAPQSTSGEVNVRRQPSFSGSTRSHRSQRSQTPGAVSSSNGQDLRIPIYTRPRTTSGSTVSMIPPSQVSGHPISQTSQSALGSVLPPAVELLFSPSSHTTDRPNQSTPAANRHPAPLPAEPPSFSDAPSSPEYPTPVVLTSNQLPANFIPMSYTPAPADARLPPLNEGNSGDGSPVIPDSALFSTDSEGSEGATSSDTLTTPPSRRYNRGTPGGSSHFTAAQVPLPPSTIAGTPHSTWRGVSTAGGAAQIPLPPSTAAGTPKPAWPSNPNMPYPPSIGAGTPWAGSSTMGGAENVFLPSTATDTPRWGGSVASKTPSNKSRPLSRSTNH
ncbi:hypothetical protein AMATHDRAFT_2557 [Amanita thiersii Skay4041]|uniref:Uncharacterized protein n=1 Tax=Amanita thiersii Skay4041 TaxID=703135 RepID=A0A2A9NPN6_9AGAR|nr:hypothetical protein AMATHDRAFT_2557 [Amanita thiersii Skay4041]